MGRDASRTVKRLGAGALFVALWIVFFVMAYNPATPPPISPGKSECASCGMTIEDSRFAGNRWVTREGKKGMPLYDDLGCLLDAEREEASDRQYVQDSEGSGWIRADRAWFTMNSKNWTPMGSGILAFRRRPSADAMTFEEVKKARHAYMKAKFGGA